MNDKEARAFHSEQRKSVPAAFPCETLESKVDYPIHYDQIDSGIDHFLEQRRLTCGLVLNGTEAEDDRASLTAMWKRQQYHPLAESLVHFEGRIEAGCPRAKRTHHLFLLSCLRNTEDIANFVKA